MKQKKYYIQINSDYVDQDGVIQKQWQTITIFNTLQQLIDYFKWLEQFGHASLSKQYNIRIIEK